MAYFLLKHLVGIPELRGKCTDRLLMMAMPIDRELL
jgi:hypothetical protein